MECHEIIPVATYQLSYWRIVFNMENLADISEP